MSERTGDWFLTYTGKKFWPMDPRAEEVCIEDIAHALSQICRFGGHSLKFYSVAQHSVLVSRIVEEAFRQCRANGEEIPDARGIVFRALLHDATEAYCGDMVRPLKVSMPAYREVEGRLWRAICEKFGLGFACRANGEVVTPFEIKSADNRALMTERRDVVVASDYPWSLEKDYPPVREVVEPLSCEDAKWEFVERFESLV